MQEMEQDILEPETELVLLILKEYINFQDWYWLEVKVWDKIHSENLP